MKKLINDADLAAVTHLKENNPLIQILAAVTGVRKVNKLYDEIAQYRDLEFIDQLLDHLGIEVEINEKDLENIPKEGSFISVSNHPFGALDGLVLLKALKGVRPDYKVMANFLLQHVEPIKDHFIAVNPFENHKSRFNSVSGLKQAKSHLAEGKPLGIFPAGEVSAYNLESRMIADRQWQTSALKLVSNAEVPVLPVYFDGSNSYIFHLLGMIHPQLRTMILPSELMKKKGKKIRLRIGKPIPAKDISAFASPDQLGRYLRAKTYALGTGLHVRKDYFKLFKFPRKEEEIIEPVDSAIIEKEIEALEPFKIFEYEEFDCFITESSNIPKLLREIGRLREITYREVGEGTNKSVDLDEYDLYYRHLILWDRKNKKFVGAYRIGQGMEIMSRYGRKGFYTNSLFRMEPQLDEILRQSFELGRSFIVKEYQKHRLPLFLLWKGILFHLISHPEYRYIIGPVSISGSFQEFSRGLIMEFVKKHYYNEELAQWVHPRNEFIVKSNKVDREALLEVTQNDLKKMDRIISEIEPSSFTMPVLLKKYLHQNAQIIGFNYDPKFNGALDGLMILDLLNLPEETVVNLKREMVKTS
ncbi:lysophospholipid acyltransferase family protein [Halocola ammonii]